MGRRGKVEVALDSVELANGDRVALVGGGDTRKERGSHVGLMVGLMVPTALVYLPATPFWLFMHGNDTTIKDGKDLDAQTDGVANLDSRDFEQRSAAGCR